MIFIARSSKACAAFEKKVNCASKKLRDCKSANFCRLGPKLTNLDLPPQVFPGVKERGYLCFYRREKKSISNKPIKG